MKHTLSILLLLGTLGNNVCHGQSSLYKAYVNRAGVEAVCITNYPIGNGVSATVTSLEISDSTLRNRVVRELLALPYAADKTGSRTRGFEAFRQLLNAAMSDSLPLPNLAKANNRTSKIEETMATGDKASPSINLPTYHDCDSAKGQRIDFTFFNADPLPGDTGEYHVVLSNLMKTIVIFHCPTLEVHKQVTRYVLNHAYRTPKEE